jgi:hypothetical protein
MTQHQKKMRLLPVLHLLAILALAVCWGAYFWKYTPSRQLFHLAQPTPHQASTAARQPSLVPKVGYLSGRQASRFAIALRAAGGDLACGALILALVNMASAVYVRRLDNFLGARTSGQAVALRGHDLTAAALHANEKKQRGVLR